MLAKEREHNKFLSELVTSLNNVEPSVELHKACYCTYRYTSKKYKRKSVDGHVPEDGPPSTRVRRSQNLVNGLSLDFKVHCLFCNEKCAPVNKRHPQRWDRVRHCQTCERPGLPTFRDTIVEIAKKRNDELGRRVLLNIVEETDLPALDAQYHVRCYNLFRPVNQNVDVSPDNVVDDAALKS